MSSIEHAVAVDGTDVQFGCAEGDTLLRAALRAGVGMSYECNSGSCGTCRFQLLDGEVKDRRPDAAGLTDRDRRKGRRLACQSEPVDDCTMRVGALTEPAPHRPMRRTAELQEVHPLTHDLSEFVFAADGPAAFSPGQYAMLTLPGGQVERAYSMSNIVNCHGNWRFVIKRVPGGEATSRLFDELDVGAAVTLDGPFGHAYLREHGRSIVCVGGGSGLGAMVSIVLGVAARNDAADWSVHLFTGACTVRDLHRPAALESVARRVGTFHVHTALSEPDEEAGAEDDWRRGFVHEVVAEVLGERLTDFTYYAAGPPAMTDALARSLILEAGLAADELHFDRFY